MASIDAQVKKLEKQVAAHRKAVAREKEVSAALRQKYKAVEKWIKLEVKWSHEVTDMLRQISWKKLSADYQSEQLPGNPPQTPPDWPPRADVGEASSRSAAESRFHHASPLRDGGGMTGGRWQASRSARCILCGSMPGQRST